MAVFNTVTWQNGDEVTSAKLQQMAQNEDWLKDNIITGHLNFILSDAGIAPRGRTPGVVAANKLEAIRVDFDSVTPVQVFILRVNLPPVFSTAPVISFSHQVFGQFTVIHLTEGERTDYCEFYMAQFEENIVRFEGSLYILALGA